MLPVLNFPPYDFRIRKGKAESLEIFDQVRKKFVSLTPEEWVRQHLLQFLIAEKKFPLSLLAVEKQLKLNNTLKRTDILVYTSNLQPLMISECKAPEVALDKSTMEQALRYNLVYNVPYLLLSNGMNHFLFKKDAQSAKWQMMDDLPFYAELFS